MCCGQHTIIIIKTLKAFSFQIINRLVDMTDYYSIQRALVTAIKRDDQKNRGKTRTPTRVY